MIKRIIKVLAREYRRLGTGFAFLLFTLCALVVTLLVLPLIRILPIGSKKRRHMGLSLVRNGFASFTWFMGVLRLMASFRVTGREHLKDLGPCLVIANHPTLIDIVALLGKVPNGNCIVKSALFHDPRFGFVLRMAGFLPNDSGSLFVDKVAQNFQEDLSLIVFPEGTRSPKDGLHNFNRGAAQIAARNPVPVVPVLISCEPITLMKGRPWYDIPERAVDFRLDIREPIQIPPEIADIKEVPRRVRALNRLFEDYFREALGLDMNVPETTE